MNLSPDKFATLKSPKDDKCIIIIPADKGRGIVIMDYTDYRTSMLPMLTDTTSYAILTNDSLQSTNII